MSKFLLAVRDEKDRKGEIFAFKTEKDRNSMIKILKKNKQEYATTTIADKIAKR